MKLIPTSGFPKPGFSRLFSVEYSREIFVLNFGNLRIFDELTAI